MKPSTIFKTIIIIPPIIAGGFVVLFFSYLLVPMLIAFTIGVIVYSYHKESTDSYTTNTPEESLDERRQRYIRESRTFSS